LACALLAFGASAVALERVNIYRVVVEGAAALSQAEIDRRAMERLLVRVTGRTDAPSVPELARLLESPSGYINSRGAPDINRPFVDFNSATVEAELARVGQPIWGSDRPLTLAWIAIENDRGERELVGADTPAGVSAEMAQLMDTVRSELRLV